MLPIIIRTIPALEALINDMNNKEYVAYDCETTGLNKSDEIIGYSLCAQEDKAYYVVLAEWNKDQQKLIHTGLASESIRLMQVLSKKNLVMHNAIFDCMMAEAFFKVRLIDALHTDTMVLAHLLDENRRVGLKDLGRSMYGESATAEQTAMKASITANGGIASATQYELYKADSELIAKYGAKDAQLTFKLFMDLVPELYAQGLEKFFYEDESMPLLKGPTYDLNTTGLTVDMQALQTLKKTLEAECLEAKDFIMQEIKPHISAKYPGTSKNTTFNIGSSGQLSWLLFGQLGLEFQTLTKGGKEACKEMGMKLPYTPSAKREFISECIRREGAILRMEAIINDKKVRAKKVQGPWKYIMVDKSTLTKLAPKHKWIQKLLEYQRATKLLNTYVEGVEERIRYGVVTSSYLQHGTMTGRYASRNPNLQNLPREDQRVKGCFVARPGKRFVSADFSQLEPRVFSYYSQDPRLMGAFTGESDFYSVVGKDTFDIFDAEPTKADFGVKYKHLRQDSKTIALASAYGATPNQIAKTTGKSVQDTEELMNRYFERFPGVRKMMTDAHKIAKEKGEVTNLFGRKRRIPEAKRITKLYGNQDHWSLPYEARKLLNVACNFRIQSTGASIVNRAAIKFHKDCKELGLECKLVSQIHDELVAECREEDAETISLLLQNAMETATVLDGITFEAEPRITKNLSK